MEIINEALDNRPRILKEAESYIELLQKDQTDKTALLNLKKAIQKFSKIQDLTIIIKPNLDNAMVIPLYNTLFKRLLNDIINNKTSHSVRMTQTINHKNIEYVQKVYIIFGHTLLKKCTPQEVMAIILHELGHIFGHTAYIIDLAGNLNNLLRKIYSKLIYFSWFPFTGIVVLILSNFSRSLSFFEHISEYNADSFVARYGYGDDMVRVAIKWKKESEKIDSKNQTSKILKYILSFMTPGRSHPTDEKRICHLKDKIFNDFKNRYKPLNKELNILFKDFKC